MLHIRYASCSAIIEKIAYIIYIDVIYLEYQSSPPTIIHECSSIQFIAD